MLNELFGAIASHPWVASGVAIFIIVAIREIKNKDA